MFEFNSNWFFESTYEYEFSRFKNNAQTTEVNCFDASKINEMDEVDGLGHIKICNSMEKTVNWIMCGV